MESFVTWRELIIVAVVVLAFYVAELLWVLKANRGGIFRRGMSPENGADRTAHLTAEIRALKEQVKGLADEVQRMKASEQTVTPYGQAIQLAKQGLDASELASICGISRGEAELIIALYRAHSQ